MSVTKGRRNLRPVTPAEMAAWLAESLRVDLEGVKEKGQKEYRLLKITLAERIGSDRLIYRMYHPGGEQPPEDVPGQLVTERGEFQGIARRQSSGLIDMEVTWPLAPVECLESALFRINCKAWVESLIERLEKKAGVLSPLASDLFNPLADNGLEGGANASETDTGDRLDHKNRVYVWTPPGTERADTLARLISECLTAGERVLVGAHSNQVLDDISSALLNLNEAWGREAVRLGWTDAERLKTLLSRARPAEPADPGPAAEGAETLESIQARIDTCRKNIDRWTLMHGMKRAFVVQETAFRQKYVEWQTKKAAVDRVEREWLRCQAELKNARKAWFNRAARIQSAGRACQLVAVRLGEAEAEVGLCRQEKVLLETRLAEMAGELAGLEDRYRDLPPKADLARELRSLESEKARLRTEQKAAAQAKPSKENPAIQARLVLTTLNESHRTLQLDSTRFDTVLIARTEKIPTSQIFLAAGRAAKRVILCGDFIYFSFETPVQDQGGVLSTKMSQTTLDFRILKKLAGAKKKDVQVIMDGPSALPKPMADLAVKLAYRPAGLSFSGLKTASVPSTGPGLDSLFSHPLALADTAELKGWCGKAFQTLSPFNLASALATVKIAQFAIQNQPAPADGTSPRVLLVSPFDAQVSLLAALIEDLELTGRVAAGLPSSLDPADLVILDAVLDQPIMMDRFSDPEGSMETKTELAQAAALARGRFVMVGSSSWLEKRSKPGSALEVLTAHIREHGAVLSMDRILSEEDPAAKTPRLKTDLIHVLTSASESIFGFLPFFDSEKWPAIEPVILAALERGVAVTLLDGLPNGAKDAKEMDEVVRSLRRAGAVLVPTTGYQGRELIIDRRFIFWRAEDLRFRELIHAPRTAATYLALLQAQEIRSKSIDAQGAARSCPECGWPLLSAFQATRQGTSDPQPFKIKCLNKKCKYARPLDERLPYKTPPQCSVDGRIRYERVRRGRGEVWQCPAHPKTCPVEKVVPGDII